MKKTVALIGIVFILFSCDVAKQLAGAYAIFTQCKYIFNSITGLSLGGINLQNINSISSINPLALANLLSAFSNPNSSLPLDFVLNLDVVNNGDQTAILNGANYILEIDGLEMTQGVVNKQIQIEAGKKTVMPIAMAFDLKKVMSGKSVDAMKNLAFNFAGIGDSSSNVSVKWKPSFVVNGKTITARDYVPISFTLNKK